jgi:hypothetical protein
MDKKLNFDNLDKIDFNKIDKSFEDAHFNIQMCRLIIRYNFTKNICLN